MFCSQCGLEVPESTKFCSRCGQSIQRPIPQNVPLVDYRYSDMSTHLQIVAWMNLIFGGIGILVGICFFGFFSFLGIGIPYLNRMNHQFTDFPFGLFFPGLGAIIFGFLTIVSLPQLLGGIGLLKKRNWGRILIIFVSIIGLFHIPLGTILSAYSLWVLFSRGTEELFRNPANQF